MVIPDISNARNSAVLPDSPNIYLAATNAHAKLAHIMARAVEYNHPVTKPICQNNGFYAVEYRKIVAVEEELDAWHQALSSSPTLSLDSNGDARMLRFVLSI